jgi:hypothetical protein
VRHLAAFLHQRLRADRHHAVGAAHQRDVAAVAKRDRVRPAVRFRPVLLRSRGNPPRAAQHEQEDLGLMEVKLGVTDNPKELEIDIDQSAEELTKTVEEALATETRVVLWLTDSRGRRVGIPTDKLAYIEIGEENPEKRVGFASH